MKKAYIPSFLATFIFTTLPAHAMCPVCTLAAVAWIELSHYFWIDDTVTGLWIGWMLVSVSMWTIDWFDKKNIKFFLKRKLIYIFYYLSVIIPLYYSKFLFLNPINKIWWIDKLFLWILIWTCLFYFSARYYLYLKENNNWHAYFPMQKVVMSIWSLLFASLIFYYLTTYIYA